MRFGTRRSLPPIAIAVATLAVVLAAGAAEAAQGPAPHRIDAPTS